MAKELMTTAKDLAWKVWRDAQLKKFEDLTPGAKTDVFEGFENWWSNNYGNRDTIQFNPKYNVYVEGKRYIQAE